MIKKPNFLVIGAPKAGTTSLYYYLRQHPEIYMSPVKEPGFFAFEGNSDNLPFTLKGQKSLPKYATNWEHYLSLFKEVRDEKAVGEVSIAYLYHPDAPKNIKKHIPYAKLIAILRNPIDRIFSAYLMHRRNGVLDCSFSDFLRLCDEKESEGFWDKKLGWYAQHLKRYYQFFDRSQIKIYLFDDYKYVPIQVVSDIYAFLEVDPNFRPSIGKYNPGGMPKSRLVQRFLHKRNIIKELIKPILPVGFREHIKRNIELLNIKTGSKPKMSLEAREELIAYYREDILELQKLIGRNLSHWLVNDQKGGR